MSQHEHAHDDGRTGGNFLTLRVGLLLIGFIIIAGALLLTEHRAHVVGALIYLPLLLCPLMHFFMHGHGRHGGGNDRDGRG